MKILNFPFSTTDWSCVEPVLHPGETGQATSRHQQFNDIRVRLVEYSPNYLADHWCSKGHIVLVLEGEFITELEDGRVITLKTGQSLQVADQAEPHRTRSANGAKLFIVD
ncbi:DHCW motif cupin fold protein [Microvirga sp. CF3016]|uniref:DHCW motif cupin fold protein n=1 Tax=Microvirga sp. CF3016 TaxID=3110181 RepID=UPI002E79D57A|nr:DHCW motif cupin fold protein [Microvirga sp. CF3016]MEE1612439.1 DHCW motif cupin fold protein [Microvirga sp. CF3016]